MKRWYPSYWHPFTWMFEADLGCLGPLERATIEKASLPYGDLPKIRPRLESPVMYYASKLRNHSCQIRRWLYAYGPETMTAGNWGKFVGWTETICTTALAIINPNRLRKGDPLTHLRKVVAMKEAQACQQVLEIGQADIPTQNARRALFPVLVRSVGLQRTLASRTKGLIRMDHQSKFQAPRQTISTNHRAGYRPRLAAIENQLLKQLRKAFDTSLVSAYLCRGEPSSIMVLAQGTDTVQAVSEASAIYPRDHDIFTWLVFEEELPLFTHESPAEHVPDCFGLTQTRQLLWGKDVLPTITVPTGTSALSCLNSVLPAVRAYSFYTKNAQGACEPAGLQPWIDSYYSPAKTLIALSRLEYEAVERPGTITSQELAAGPRTVEEGLLEIETATSCLNLSQRPAGRTGRIG